MTRPWSMRARTRDLVLDEPVAFRNATLVENCFTPHSLAVTSQLENLRPVLAPGMGCVLTDDTGVQRFSGFVANLERNGDNTGTVTFTGDLGRLWHRLVWPVYTGPWSTSGQNVSYDVQTAPAETRILTYVNRNAGSIAYNAGGVDRRIARLRLPATLGRGPSARTSARFDNLGQLVADLAETANLRVDLIQTYTGTTPYLDLRFTVLPDYSAWARFGTSAESGPGLLDNTWRYTVAIPTGTAILGAATGDGSERFLQARTPDTDAQTLWGMRIESFVDISSSSEPSEVTEALTSAYEDRKGTVELDAPLVSTPELAVGTEVPLGATVTAVLDGEAVVDRIRTITTTISGESGATVKITPAIGNSDTGPRAPTQRRLAAALARISALERNR